LHYWQAATDEVNRQNLTRREELRIRGLYAAELQDYNASEAAFTQMETEYPRDYLASFYLGDALRWHGRLDAALQKFQAAERKNTKSIAVISNLAGVALLSSREKEFGAALERLQSLGASDLAAYYRGLFAFSKDDTDGAIAAFRETITSTNQDRRSRAYGTLAAVLAEIGRYAEARQALEQGIAKDRLAGREGARADKILMLANIDFHMGRIAPVKRLCIEAATAESSPQRSARSAVLLARAGYAAEAKAQVAWLSRLPSCPLVSSALLRVEGETALVEGKPARAIESFLKSSSVEPSLQPKEYLARAYFAAGDYDKASVLFRRIATAPALLWETVDFDYPGIFSECLRGWSAAAARAHDDNGVLLSAELDRKRRHTQ
jgi:tetratricopeptide (TPR) repeat protein